MFELVVNLVSAWLIIYYLSRLNELGLKSCHCYQILIWSWWSLISVIWSRFDQCYLAFLSSSPSWCYCHHHQHDHSDWSFGILQQDIWRNKIKVLLFIGSFSSPRLLVSNWSTIGWKVQSEPSLFSWLDAQLLFVSSFFFDFSFPASPWIHLEKGCKLEGKAKVRV